MCISVDDTIKEAEARIAQFLDQRYRCHEIMKPGSPMPRRPHGAFLQDVALQVSAEKVRIFSDIEFFPCFFFFHFFLSFNCCYGVACILANRSMLFYAIFLFHSRASLEALEKSQ